MALDSTVGKERSKRRKGNLPKKPRTDFPLSPHSRGFWYRTINGKMNYFGRWGRMVDGKFVRFEGEEYEAEWKKALALYESQSEDFKTGLVREMDSPKNRSKITLAVLCHKFMEDREGLLQSGEIGLPMLKEYKGLCQTLLRVFGESRDPATLGPEDFQKLRRDFSKRLGATRLKNCIIWTRTIFAWAYHNERLEKPIRCLDKNNTTVFQPPTARVERIERAKKPKKILAPAQCKLLIDAAPAPIKAWILLGLNAGFGPMDCAMLRLDVIDGINFKNPFVDYPRPKTGIDRRVMLWPETIEAIRAAIAKRSTPKHDDAKPLVFVTGIGRSFVGSKTGKANQISVMVRKLMIDTGVHQEGFGGYTFRSIYRTVADETKDEPAINFTMGHSDGSQGERYRQEISDKRLQAVSDHVHRWLFGKKKPK